ncbi:MAG: regulatory protein TetR [Gammaproteobacteria bacterium]|jgi:AcrR family transcriptional regulator|nr:regulatory protein TetR [Gammaproteobacteria bacterium]
MSREDSREQTTQRLLDAAQKLIAKKGLEAASVENIAAAAGYTRGAFYSNFSSKDDLFIELLRRDHQKSTAQLTALRDSSLSVDRLQSGASEVYSQIYRDNESFMNWTEARMLAARDARFRTKLNALVAEKCAQIADFTRYFYERVGVAPPLPPEQMAMGFMSMAEGVKLYMMSSPAEMTSPIAESLLTLFADSIMGMATMEQARLEADSTKRK